MRVLTFGTFDLLHIGHINIIKRAKALGDYLIVGISSDQLNYQKKQIYPVYNEGDRRGIVRSLRYVDEVFIEESLDLKRDYILKYNADILVMGDDWKGKFDEFSDICKVLYLPRTQEISTSEIKTKIKDYI